MVVCCRVRSQHFPGGYEGLHGYFQSEYPTFRPQFYRITSPVLVDLLGTAVDVIAMLNCCCAIASFKDTIPFAVTL